MISLSSLAGKIRAMKSKTKTLAFRGGKVREQLLSLSLSSERPLFPYLSLFVEAEAEVSASSPLRFYLVLCFFLMAGIAFFGGRERREKSAYEIFCVRLSAGFYARREKLFSITTPLLPLCLFHFASSSSSSSSCFALFCGSSR